MAVPVVLNNTSSLVQAGSTAIGSATNTGINVATGDGAKFGTLTNGQYLSAVIVDTSTSPKTIKEYVWVTAISGDALTVTRAAESSTTYPASTTSIQAGYTIAAVATKGTLETARTRLPAGIVASGDYYPPLNLYVPIGSKPVKTRAGLAKTQAKSGRLKIAVVGPSNVSGYNGTTSLRGSGDYPFLLSKQLQALGYSAGEMAFVMNDQISPDFRITVTGTWTWASQPAAAVYTSGTNGATATFPCTNPTDSCLVDISALAAGCTIKIDGVIPAQAGSTLASTVVTPNAHCSYNSTTGTITPDGTGNHATVTITNLPFAVHSLLLTASGNTTPLLVEFYWSNAVSVANWGQASSQTSHWADTSQWFNGIEQVLAWADVMLLDIGLAANDYLNAVALATTLTNLTTIVTAAQAAGIEVIINTTLPFLDGSNNPPPTTFWQNQYTLADAKGMWLIDNNDRMISHASMAANGLVGSDNFHPNAAGYEECAMSIINAFPVGTGQTNYALTLTQHEDVALRPQGSIVETLTRRNITLATIAHATGVLHAMAIGLQAGDVVNSISFMSGGTAGATLTHQWFALLDANGKVLAVSADATSAAWAANTVKTLNMATPYRVAALGTYYLAKMVAATTTPTFQGMTLSGTAVVGLTPILAATSGSALTTPATVGTVFTLASFTSLEYGYAS